MTTYYINLYPQGIGGDRDFPEAYAYHDDAFPPVKPDGIQLKVTIADPQPPVTVEVIQ